MNMIPDDADMIKLTVDQLYDTEHGKIFIEWIEKMAGKYQPQYDATSQVSVNIAAGRSEVMQSIRTIQRLDREQARQLLMEGK